MPGVQFNLLPDSKLAHNRAQAATAKLNRLAQLAVMCSAGLFLLLLVTVEGLQRQQLSSSQHDLESATKQLKNIPNIDNILTVQNQLGALVQLHQNKHVTSRLFTYLPQLTPADVTINKLDLDIGQATMIIAGKASSQHSVNTFVDTLKVAQYKVGSQSVQPAFTSVVESGFNINASSIGYTINLQFDPRLFANNLLDSSGKPQAPQLVVKNASTGSLDPSSTLFNSSQTGTGGR